MDRVEAIKVLTLERAAHRKDGLVERAIDMAIAALREQEGKDIRVTTNADKIRAMPDEELAVIIMCPYDTEPDLCNHRGDCLGCCTDWLQQPCE